MSKIATASEYRKKQRKLVELPSGFIFEIRKLSPIAYGEVLDKMGIKPTQANSEEAENIIRDRMLDVMKLVLPEGVVSPKIAIESDDEDVLLFSDLDLNDVTVLLEEIYDFSGLTSEAQVEREEFREDESG